MTLTYPAIEAAALGALAGHRRRQARRPGEAAGRRRVGAGGPRSGTRRHPPGQRRGNRLERACARPASPRATRTSATRAGGKRPWSTTPGSGRQPRRQQDRIADLAAVVGDQAAVGGRAGVRAQLGVAELAQSRRQPEGVQLERDRGADLRDRLRRVGDHDEPVGRRGDDLLARVRAAAALDQPAVRGDLVSAVDRDIEAVEPVELLDRDAERARLILGRRPTSRRSGSRARARRSPAADGRRSSPSRARQPSRRRPVRRPPRRRAAFRHRGSRPTSNPIARFRTALVRLRSMAPEEQSLRRVRRARREHDPHALDRCDPEGELRAIPGTPMALAPVAYVLWQRFLRFDPAQPIWPNRDRFVLSAGHASMLLYALLHLAGVRAVDSDYEVEGRRVDHARRHQELPPARLEGRRPPRVPLGLRGRDDDRPTRPGRRDLRRDGRCVEMARRPTSTGPGSSCSTSTPT